MALNMLILLHDGIAVVDSELAAGWPRCAKQAQRRQEYYRRQLRGSRHSGNVAGRSAENVDPKVILKQATNAEIAKLP